MPIEDIGLLNSPRIQAIQDRMKSAKDEQSRLRIAQLLFKEMRKNSVDIVERLEKGIPVNNFDVVKASLHNEFARNTKAMLKAMKEMQISAEEQSSILAALVADEKREVDNSFETIKIPRATAQRMVVENIGDITIPSDFYVNNFSHLEPYFNALSETIKEALNIKIEAPKVTVEAPNVKVDVPETKINIPDLDLSPLLKALESGLNRIKTNSATRPLAVRLSDGKEFISRLVEVIDKGNKQVLAAYSGDSYLKTADGNRWDGGVTVGGGLGIGDGSKTVATAGTREALSSTSVSCRYVIITALSSNTNSVYLGGSTIAAGRGRPLVSLQSEKLDVNNLNKIFLDVDTNGEGVSYVYVT